MTETALGITQKKEMIYIQETKSRLVGPEQRSEFVHLSEKLNNNIADLDINRTTLSFVHFKEQSKQK